MLLLESKLFTFLNQLDWLTQPFSEDYCRVSRREREGGHFAPGRNPFNPAPTEAEKTCDLIGEIGDVFLSRSRPISVNSQSGSAVLNWIVYKLPSVKTVPFRIARTALV